MQFNRRRFLKGTLSASAGLALARSPQWTAAQAPASQAARNKAVVRRFKESQGTPDEAAVMREIMSPNYKRARAGVENLANNARDQDFPSPGPGLRAAFPDRADFIEDMIAEDDRVGMLWRLTGTHRGNFLGIPATGKKIDIYEIGFFRVSDGKITDGWFMADEAGLLKQLGARLPVRKDGKLIAPPVTDAGEDGDVALQRLLAKPQASQEDRNKIIIARSKSSTPIKEDRAPNHQQRRLGLQHLRDYATARGVAQFTPTTAFPGRNDRITGLTAEGDKVWMQFNLRGTHTASFYGLPPTGRRVEMPEVGIMRVVDGKWVESWYFGDELGMLLQLGAVHMLDG
jgi:predicted ester cyclase